MAGGLTQLMLDVCFFECVMNELNEVDVRSCCKCSVTFCSRLDVKHLSWNQGLLFALTSTRQTQLESRLAFLLSLRRKAPQLELRFAFRSCFDAKHLSWN